MRWETWGRTSIGYGTVEGHGRQFVVALLSLFLGTQFRLALLANGSGLVMTSSRHFVTFEAFRRQYSFTLHFRVIFELMAPLRAFVDIAVQHCATSTVSGFTK
jgi:hypothetical protein